MYERVATPARGRSGGVDGARGVVRLASGPLLKAKGLQLIPAGDRLVLELPGGAGLGDPALRDAAAIEADRSSGLVGGSR